MVCLRVFWDNLKIKIIEAGEVAQQLRALTPEDSRFNSQQTYGSSQPCGTLVPVGPIPSHRHTSRPNTNEHEIKVIYVLKR